MLGLAHGTSLAEPPLNADCEGKFIMEDWAFSSASPLATRSISRSAELERCYQNRWISEPERNLMLAVLEDAIRCFLGYREGDPDPRNRLAYADARDWINSPGRYSIFAFRNLCEIVGLDPDCLRRELNRIRRGSSPRTVALQRMFDVRSLSVSSSNEDSTSRRGRRARTSRSAGYARSAATAG